MNYFNQASFELRCEWGEKGVQLLAPISDVVIIIDVLSFSTCIDLANSRGAIVFPYQWRDDSAEIFAQSVGAKLAGVRQGKDSPYSLSPVTLLGLSAGEKLVLPSPNGSSLSLATSDTPTLTGCLRNCQAVAKYAMNYGRKIAVIPAGEKWHDGSLRPSFEDFIAAGAVLNYLEGTLSPESRWALESYQGVSQSLKSLLWQCGSGKELIEQGFEEDVILASQFNVSNCVPTLVDRAYINLAQ